MHYVIIIIFIIIIILLQISVYVKTNEKLIRFGNIFPKTVYEELTLLHDGDIVRIVSQEDVNNALQVRQQNLDELKQAISESKKKIKDLQILRIQYEEEGNIEAEVVEDARRKEKTHLQELTDRLSAVNNTIGEIPAYSCENEIRNTIISSINKYLERNISSTSDFHLIKDIVDRNSDAAENEIQTQVPVPLYCGLMGTMLGIIVGIMYLWLSGDLDALLGVSQVTGTGASGIKALLGGVALAMISSIVGIALTTSGAWKVKMIKSEEESSKHLFLSWMQTELLPAMNTDAASAMQTMVDNLAAFNTTFATNTKELNASLSLVSDATKGQAEILESINNLKINHIATANIEVYDKLKNCTTEIGLLGTYLQDTRQYLSYIRELNAKLDDANERSRMIEEMADFFRKERASIERVSGIINYSMGEADSALQKSISILKDNIAQQNADLVQHMVEQNQRLVHVLDEQQTTLEKKAHEIDKLMAELTQLTDVKKSMQGLEKVMNEQNKKIDTLARSITELAQIKVSGGVISHSSLFSRLPKWAIITLVFILGASFIWLNVWMILSYINEL